MSGKKKNILVLMADQLNPRFLKAHGFPVGHTPTIDRLAREGVVFDSAYCNSPLCAPARYSFVSGQLPSAIRAYDNAAELPASTPTFAHHLRAAGYRTVLAGKMHFCGPEQLHGFEERLTTDIYPADFGWVPDWRHPNDRLDWYHNMASVTDAGPCVRTNQLDFDDEVVYATRQKLYDLARERDERPFLLVASLTHPHDPFAIPNRYWNLFEGVDIPAPEMKAGDVTDDPHSARIRAVCELDKTPVSDEDTQRARRAYLGAIAYVDEQFGSILQVLEDTGQAEDTMVVVISDHGEMLGERGLWYKMSFFEGATRIPLIVHAPGRFAPHRVQQSVSQVDLLPTLAELAGAPVSPGAGLAGRSLLPHLQGQGGHDEVIGEYLAEGAVAPIVMLRRGVHKFIHSPADPDQLYDLGADPHELRNLAADPAHQAALDAFRAEVRARWNLNLLHQRVLRSQAERRLVRDSESIGLRRHWDYQPPQDASLRYIRNHLKLDDLEAKARFPRVVPLP